MWSPGELERLQAFYAARASRFAHRAVVMQSLAGSPTAYSELFDQYAALLRRNEAEDEFEDTVPDTNQNVW